MFVVADTLIWGIAFWGALLIRFEGDIPASFIRRIPLMLVVLIPAKILWHSLYHQYRVTWRLVGLTDLVNVWKANSLGSISAVAALVLLHAATSLALVSRSVLILDYILSLLGIAVLRTGRRLWDLQRDGIRRSRKQGAKRVLLVGAGAAGERLARAMLENPGGTYRPVGFVDDDPQKHGTFVHNLRVFGDRATIADAVRLHDVDEVVIAIPSASSAQLVGIVEFVRGAGVKDIRILPGVNELLSSGAGLKDIRNVNLDDLLGRPPVTIAMDAIAAFLANRRVLVTGAAGSIGLELVRQLTRFQCAEIIAVDINESGLFELEETVALLQTRAPVRALVADIRDREKLDWVLRTYRPHVLYHAAAYKHVPMMERHAEEAVKTNVLGTFHLAEAALRAGVETFVLISTDKAVNPKGVMGATKCVAEKIIQTLSRRGGTRFLAVRFGNVLGSRGSLIPLIQDQIRRGGPVTLTHPEMRRYFMSSAEAVLLVLQASTMEGRTGIFLLDMGTPIKIVDLAGELIRLSGLEPDRDIPIVFTGVRAGEKMEEELTGHEETVMQTPFDRIFEVRSTGIPDEMILRLALQEIERLARNVDGDGIRALLEYLSTAQPTSGGVAASAAIS
jgi:FlaA1/EpsC-like NDP-sugar epimerase